PDTQYCDWVGAPKYRDFLLCDDKVWDDVVAALPSFKVNTLVIDLGDGICYESHPELAISGSWSKEKLASKLAKIRELGITPIPKLNFSTGHDAWLKQYSRMVSTPEYYKVVADLIAETAELFSSPKLIHLGMDEETYQHQNTYAYSTVRQGELWWSDVYYMFACAEKASMRPWVWSDYFWHNPELFIKKMPREVLQSNWEYGGSYHINEDGTFGGSTGKRAFVEIDRLGFEQVPTGSNWDTRYNMEILVEACMKTMNHDNIAGFMMAPWAFTDKRSHFVLMDGASRLRDAYENNYLPHVK
ncbi:MAG: Tat pathway signal protein, partial [Bacteroidales bacterium]|nr:Tat pathway signal protein [Bacteroidales bacterium]